ncbi:BTB/POZ domain [Mollivirus sibericum]|uniref:BTB/POZ domain n=1 Tax=Mollivirus sibericum TaxID=1678078 RepID=UPI0006B2DEDA|nr:BTB/POZ domain [Mollivirus sibericum]ALD62030.1 BTB/POZ domain [Mollivirus sibericum]
MQSDAATHQPLLVSSLGSLNVRDYVAQYKWRSLPDHAIVRFNVGGKLFRTCVSTVRAHPDCLLVRMLDGEAEPILTEDGCFFIDRDSKLFRYVIGYMRSPLVGADEPALLPTGVNELDRLTQEADYYNLPDLARIAKTAIEAAARDKTMKRKALQARVESLVLRWMVENRPKCSMRSRDVAAAKVACQKPVPPIPRSTRRSSSSSSSSSDEDDDCDSSSSDEERGVLGSRPRIIFEAPPIRERFVAWGSSSAACDSSSDSSSDSDSDDDRQRGAKKGPKQ